MADNSNIPKEVFIKNKYRELKHNLGDGDGERYQPEYERLGRAPKVESVAGDFKRYNRATTNTQRVPDKNMAVASGHSAELSWVPRSELEPNAQIKYDEIPNPPVPSRVIVTDNLNMNQVAENMGAIRVGHVRAGGYLGALQSAADRIEEPDGPINAVSIDDIAEGNYFVVAMDVIVAESSDLDEIEAFVESIALDSKSSIKLEDIIVLRKMKLKIGVSIG
jgi:hypothetical protein